MRPTSQGLFSLGLFALTVLVLVLAAAFPDLRANDLFKTLAQAIVITGLINLAASFEYGASKSQPPYSPAPPAPTAAAPIDVSASLARIAAMTPDPPS